LLKIYANIPEETIATHEINILSKSLLGVISPYPTVPIVIAEK
jgi:hypothetical protein